NTVAVLTAAPDAGSAFVSWTGACNGTSLTCSVSVDAAKSVTATFAQLPPAFTLSVTRAGSGTGSVTSTPAGIDCGTDCSESYPQNLVITLNATASGGSVFREWSGACSGASATCLVTLSAAKSVTATFDPPPPPPQFTLSVVRAGTGNGTVTSAVAGINCGTDCSESYPINTVVVLTAA